MAEYGKPGYWVSDRDQTPPTPTFIPDGEQVERLARAMHKSSHTVLAWGSERASERRWWTEKAKDMLVNVAHAGIETSIPRPPLPDEPPVGTVLAGKHEQLWQRGSVGWWKAGGTLLYRWEQALEQGADPARVLVELPHPKELERRLHNTSFDSKFSVGQVLTALRKGAGRD